MKEYKREFDYENPHDYCFFAGRNKYDKIYGFVDRSSDPEFEDKTNEKLVWNVFWHDFNKKYIQLRNVFELNWPMNGDLYGLYKETNRELFDYKLRSEIMSELWSRSEYELIIDTWCGEAPEFKVDVYTQIMINWPQFEEYCWTHRRLFKKFKNQHKQIEDVRKYWREECKKAKKNKYGKL